MITMEETNLDSSNVENVLDRITLIHHKALAELFKLWKDIYEFTDTQRSSLLERFVEYVEQHCGTLVESQRERKLEYQEKILEMLELKKTLEEELLVSIDLDPLLSTKPLKDQETQLKETLDKYRIEREKKIAAFHQLINQEAELCQRLGEIEHQICHDKLPTEDEIESYKKHIDHLNTIKVQRLKFYSKIRKQLIKTLELLEIDAETSFQLEVLNEDEDNLILTESRMDELMGLEKLLTDNIKSAEAKKESLIKRVQHLWKRINLDQSNQDEFIKKNAHFGSKTIENVENEIQRCENIMKENLESITESVRQDIEEIWTKLTYTEEQKRDFTPFESDEFTEDLLMIHEEELEKLNNYYSKYREIYELASKRESLLERMVHLEMLANDKSRLFNNRGGQLLKEEKERKMIENNLPKIEKQMELLLNKYVETEKSKFLRHGKDLQELMSREWEERCASKENKKLMKKAEQMKIEVVPRTGLNSAKRKIQRTPDVGLDGNHKIPGAVCVGRTPTSCKVKQLEISNSSVASYSDFQEKIEKSATPRSALKEVNCAHSSPTEQIQNTPHRAAKPVLTVTTTPRTPDVRQQLISKCFFEDDEPCPLLSD